MANKKPIRKETLYYLHDKKTDLYSGKLADYLTINPVGRTLEELKKNTKEQLVLIMQGIAEILADMAELQLVPVNDAEDFLWVDCNSTNWELERFKYLLAKDPVFYDLIYSAIMFNQGITRAKAIEIIDTIKSTKLIK
jgi:hypothetical protein